MGNSIEEECIKKYGECQHWGALHGEFDYHDERFKNCHFCNRPVREAFEFYEKRGTDKVSGV